MVAYPPSLAAAGARAMAMIVARSMVGNEKGTVTGQLRSGGQSPPGPAVPRAAVCGAVPLASQTGF